MDRITAEILCRLTEDFYSAQGRAFGATRRDPWNGWNRVLRELGLAGAADAFQACSAPTAGEPALEEGLFRNFSVPFTALDVGAGNLRFFRYLRSALPADMQLDLYAVDNNESLLPDEEALANEMPYLRFQKVDVLQRLLHGADLAEAIEAPPCSLTVSFGFMHHVPGFPLRAELLDALARMAAPGGFVAVSFWQFMDSPDLAAKAEAIHPQAIAALGIDPGALDEGDYLLGWQDAPLAPGGIRYCHHFTAGEIDALAAAVSGKTRPVACFESDGRTGKMNRYLLLQVL